MMFFFVLMMGTMITISSNSWLGAWMGLEINLLSFIPLMSDNNNLMSTEASLKYFLTQALASTILLFAIILLMLKINVSFMMIEIIYMMISSCLLLKMGAAPFHFWFPNVIEGLSWENSLILMTWQKIAPLMLISYLLIKPLIMVSVILSSIIGALGGLNQTSLRKLLAFSSINHLSWMLASMYFNETLWIFYFLMYSFLTFSIIFSFSIFKLNHINQLLSLHFNSIELKYMLFFNFLSLGGLPPFLGFIPKWYVIQMLIAQSQILLLTIMVMMALVTLFFYLRLCYTTFLLKFNENNWYSSINLNKITMNVYLSISFTSTFGMILMSLLYYIF
uniref:NADH-ubiquinone oxidoreductase chain 2 n=1 Tax=Anthomyza sp. DY-2021 TaxID=2803647 RepID=A0A7U0FVZ3_9MUSC|nr:NADH dehydrogenase subunit 2 [Anthomyza sp. DY-2021]